MTNQVSDAFSALGQSLKSISKILLQSQPWDKITVRSEKRSNPIIILGNGPSLLETIDTYAERLADSDTMAVNFAANAPEFFMLKPKYYILVDPHFFINQSDPNVSKLWQNIDSANWTITLLVPRKFAKNIPAEIRSNAFITIATINPIGIEGWRWLENISYSQGWGMPRPRNVLIAAIMAAILLGYKDIYIVGADHSWLKTISVDSENHVVSIQPHFYKEDDKELKRIRTDYLQYPLHQILHSFYVAFKSYHQIKRYADHAGINIYNSTPESFIDAFPHRPLPL